LGPLSLFVPLFPPCCWMVCLMEFAKVSSL
jgi:hypothetical protein